MPTKDICHSHSLQLRSIPLVRLLQRLLFPDQ